MHVDHEACYRAVLARDARFDGRFYTAVSTTGIYCRPSCPARTPEAKNVCFYPCAAAAEEAGFRACRRCRPERAPGDPEWHRRADLVGRALRLVSDGVVADEGVPGLARRLHVGERHLRRLFAEELGASPLSVAATHRLALARMLVDQTDVPLTQVAFAAGFSSIRRFNAAMLAAYGRAPRDLRRGEAGGGAGIEVHVPARLPFDGGGVLWFLGVHATPGMEEVVDGTYRRAVDGGVLEITPTAAGITVRVDVEDVRTVGFLVQRAKRIFDVDADPVAIADALGADAVLARIDTLRPGVRVPGAGDPFETAVRIVLGQQVSVAGAGTLAGRIVRLLGSPLVTPSGGLTHRFPSPAALAASDLAGVGLTGQRTATVRALAAAVADGSVVLDGSVDRDATVAALLALPGIGPWTAALVAAIVLGDPDSIPLSDLGLRRAFTRIGQPLDARTLARRAATWSPWRSYATFLLWASLSIDPDDLTAFAQGARP